VISLRTAGLSIRREPRCTHLTIQHWALGLIIPLAGCICASQAFGQNLQSDKQPNIIRGTVVNAVTHDPVGRALVYSHDDRYATLTDGEGHFEFAPPKAAADSGGIGLAARKPGFLDDPNERSRGEASPGAEFTISLVPEALIKGRVTVPAGDAARGVPVEILIRQVEDGRLRWMRKNSAATNSNGEFRFADLPPGTYKLLTREWMDNDPDATVPGGQLYGFPPVYYPSATDFATAATIRLAAGQTVQADFSLVRQAYYPVRIPVTNTESNGGNITVSPQGQRGPGYSLGYNTGKQAIEGQLPNGKYLVEAAMYGPNSSAFGSVNITVAGAPVEGHGMVLMRNNSITVNVKEEFTSTDGRASGTITNGGRTFAMPKLRLDLNVWAESADDFAPERRGSLRPPTGPNDDSLVLENLAPGRYWLRPQASRGYIASATMGGTDLLREPLIVVPGASTSIDVTMRDDNAEIDGTLLGVPAIPSNSGHSTPPGYVYCVPLPDSPGQFLELSVYSDGKFDYQMVAPGNYRVLAFKNQHRDIPYRDAEEMKLYETKGQIVHVAPGQKVSVQLEIISSAE
jgi:hypothetical protein